MRSTIANKLEELTGKYGVYYKNLSTGEEILHVQGQVPEGERLQGKVFRTEGDQFLSASVIKIFVMAEAYRQIEAGIRSPGESIALKEEDKLPSGGIPNYAEEAAKGYFSEDLFPESGILNYLHANAEFTLKDLIVMMIVISDNTATNILIRLLGMDNINLFIESMGMKATRLNRLLFDSSFEKRGLENTISLKETGVFLERIYKKELISEKASLEMSAILQNQQFNYKIPFFINHLPIAHKTGEDSGIANDVGIIFGKKPFIFCFSANYAEVPLAERACQDLAREAYRHTFGV